MSEWQPIETAPKDGTDILIWEKWCDTPVVGFWSQRAGKWLANPEHIQNGECTITQQDLTHWMPLPPAPADTGGDGK